jgi:hypothetical protein
MDGGVKARQVGIDTRGRELNVIRGRREFETASWYSQLRGRRRAALNGGGEGRRGG